MERPQKHLIRQRILPYTKEYMLDDSIYVKLTNREKLSLAIEIRTVIVGCED